MKLFTLFTLVCLSNAQLTEEGACTDAGVCRTCRKDPSVCVSRNVSLDCRWDDCPGKPDWAKHGKNKTKVGDRFKINKKFKDTFLDGDDYKSLTKEERKQEKQRFIKEHRGEVIKFKKKDEDALSYDAGGIKMTKRWALIKKQGNLSDDIEFPFKMVDDPDYVGDTIEVLPTDMIFFEDEARFMFKHHNYTLKTVRKTAAEGYHKTTFTQVDDGASCEIDGATDAGCRIDGPDKVKFEMLFSGSGGGSAAISHCLSQETHNIITLPDSKLTFNAVPWDGTEYVGMNVGTYVFNNEANPGHPLLIDPLVIDGEDVFTTNCTEWKNDTPTEGCIGNYTVTIHGEFNIHKYRCAMHGPMGGEGNNDEGRLLFDDTCDSVEQAEPLSIDDDDDDNTVMIILAVLGSFVFIVLVMIGLQKTGYAKFFSEFDPIVNGHLVNSV